jgi:hypothetical protein
MREIKFRQYDKVGKKMYHWDKQWICSEYQSLSFKIREPQEGNYSLDFEYDELSEPMQFTGLKDKNGKEIYEGDILAVEDCHDSNTQHWDNQAQKPIPLEIVWGDFGNNVPYDNYYFKVIGNIYENANLLNRSQGKAC